MKRIKFEFEYRRIKNYQDLNILWWQQSFNGEKESNNTHGDNLQIQKIHVAWSNKEGTYVYLQLIHVDV